MTRSAESSAKFGALGMPAASVFRGLGDYSIFTWKAIQGLFRRPLEVKETIRQIYLLGSKSAPLVLLSGLAVGAVMSMHTRSSFERFGADSMIPTALAIAILKETGPLVAALLVAGRVGAGIGAELGGMRVTEQIDALEALAIDSHRFLVSTRLAACLIAQPVLTIFMDAAGITGGYLAETLVSGVGAKYYFQQAFLTIQFSDLVPATLKTVVFGLIIASVSSYLGYTASGGAEGVGQASTRSVVWSSMTIIAVNVVLVKSIAFVFPG